MPAHPNATFRYDLLIRPFLVCQSDQEKRTAGSEPSVASQQQADLERARKETEGQDASLVFPSLTFLFSLLYHFLIVSSHEAYYCAAFDIDGDTPGTCFVLISSFYSFSPPHQTLLPWRSLSAATFVPLLSHTPALNAKDNRTAGTQIDQKMRQCLRSDNLYRSESGPILRQDGRATRDQGPHLYWIFLTISFYFLVGSWKRIAKNTGNGLGKKSRFFFGTCI